MRQSEHGMSYLCFFWQRCHHGGPALNPLLTLIASRGPSSKHHDHKLGVEFSAHELLGSTFIQGQTIIPPYSVFSHGMPQPVIQHTIQWDSIAMLWASRGFCSRADQKIYLVYSQLLCIVRLWQLVPVRKTLANGAYAVNSANSTYSISVHIELQKIEFIIIIRQPICSPQWMSLREVSCFTHLSICYHILENLVHLS